MKKIPFKKQVVRRRGDGRHCELGEEVHSSNYTPFNKCERKSKNNNKLLSSEI
jgi:hypothetical protein